MGELVGTDRGDFFVERSGPLGGPTAVFVAGLGDDHSSWADVVQRLSPDIDCVTFDNRGIGRSVIDAGSYSMTGFAADAEALARTLGLGSLVAIGSSMGGFICQEWALAEPDRINRLVLTNTAARMDRWAQALLAHWQELAAGGRRRDLLYQLAVMCFSPAFFDRCTGGIENLLATMPVPDLAGFAASAQACQPHDALSRLGSIAVPTLVIGAEHDIVFYPELSVELAEAIPDAEVRWLPTGHMTFLEDSDGWVDIVRTFISTTQAGAV